MKEFSAVFSNAKMELVLAFQIRTRDPLTEEAYTISKGVVSISDKWVEQLKEAHTIRTNPARDEAQKLIDELEAAVTELNKMVEGNPHFGKGVTSCRDTRRCLCYLDELGGLVKCPENLQYI
jgi:hypothetical protein